ncbi:hypothetical protein WG904_19235 [Pedobacter sp. Du54]|uniref:hypothetical protein n=1 Tax=Pedobacter anseongensis TaxID=3133439 RepID=UPI003096F2B9
MSDIVLHVQRFLQVSSKKEKLTAWHISFYLAVCFASLSGNLVIGFRSSRSRIMAHAHIRGRTAYHRYLKDLIALGLIRYEPSYHPTKASLFKLAPID